MNDPTAGEVGGIFAGVVALLAVMGKGLRWWLGWTDRRAATRAAKLDAWHKQLDEREQRIDRQQEEYWARIQGEIDRLRSENAAVLSAYQLIAARLRAQDPDDEALKRADELLRSTLLESALPATFTAIARKLDQID
jgi:hypothetical protein